MDITEIDWEDADLIHLAQDWDKWQAVVNTVMNRSVSCGKYLD
jgi:hypothetical protein